MAKVQPSAADLGQRLAEVAGMLDRAVAVLNETLIEIKAKEEVDCGGGSESGIGGAGGSQRRE
jgi:hypothetical protein